MKKTAKPITKEEAVAILASALSYCQQAGLSVMAHHDAGALVLTLPGLTVAIQDGRAVFGLAGDGTPPGYTYSDGQLTSKEPEAGMVRLIYKLHTAGSDGTLAGPGDGTPPVSGGTSSKSLKESDGTEPAQAA